MSTQIPALSSGDNFGDEVRTRAASADGVRQRRRSDDPFVPERKMYFESTPRVGEERLVIEYWMSDGSVPSEDHIHNLLDLAECNEVRRKPTVYRPSGVTFPFDSPRERERVRTLLRLEPSIVDYLWLLGRRTLSLSTDTVTANNLTPRQYDLARAVCQIAGIENHAQCVEVDDAEMCTNFIPTSPRQGCGCAYVPAAAQLSTLVALGVICKGETPSADVLRMHQCRAPDLSRLIFYRHVVVDGIVMLNARRTPRSARSERSTPPLRESMAT